MKDISYEKVIELFPGQGIDRSNFAEKLIENLDKPEVFSKIFEVVE